MDPFSIAAIIGGGASVLSSIFGGISESNNTQYNNALMEQMLKEQKLGATDARGNSTKFVDGKGWVTQYGETDRALEDYYLNQELPVLQDQFNRADTASRRDYTQSNALLDEFNRIQKPQLAEIEDLLYSQASRGIGKQTNEALDTAMRAVMRSGSSHGGKIASDINAGALEALGNAEVDSKLKALGYVDDTYNANRGNVASLYNQFADQARASLNPTTNAGDTPTASVAGTQTYQPQQADNGLANALGGVGSALSGTINTMQSGNQNNSTNALLQAFLQNSGGNVANSNAIPPSMRTKNKIGNF